MTLLGLVIFKHNTSDLTHRTLIVEVLYAGAGDGLETGLGQQNIQVGSGDVLLFLNPLHINYGNILHQSVFLSKFIKPLWHIITLSSCSLPSSG